MRYDNALVEFSTTPKYIFLAFIFFLLLLHLVLIKVGKFSDIFWKKVDYVWLAAAVLGLYASSTQLNHALAKSYIENGEALRTVSSYNGLHRFLNGELWVCTPSQLTAYSPPNFDAIVRERIALCKQARDVARRLPKALPDDYPSLESMGYVRIGEHAKYDQEFGRVIETWAGMYRDQRSRYMTLVAASKPTSTELTVNLFGPVVLAFALALRITKVSGEIKNAKAKLAA